MSAKIFNRVSTEAGFDYFRAHQEGTRNMPRRAMMGVNQTVDREVNRIVNAEIKRDIASRV